MPAELEVTGRTASGVMMALRHRDLPLEGVQFHPESVLTEGGHRLLANWLATCGDPDARRPRGRASSPLVSPPPATARPQLPGRRRRRSAVSAASGVGVSLGVGGSRRRRPA